MLFSAFLLDKKDNCEDSGGGDDTDCKGDGIAQQVEGRRTFFNIGVGVGNFAAGAKRAGVAIDGGAVVTDISDRGECAGGFAQGEDPVIGAGCAALCAHLTTKLTTELAAHLAGIKVAHRRLHSLRELTVLGHLSTGETVAAHAAYIVS